MTIIDLGSDTATQPSRAMREFMAYAPVGDESMDGDPSVNALQDRVAALLGKEAALYLPSATMANEIAIKVHTQPGDEVIADRTAHILVAELGGPAALSGVMVSPLDGQRGVFTADQAEEAIRLIGPYSARSRLVVVEQTSNRGGGTVWPLETLRAVAAMTRRRGLRTHIDGARLMNAVVASGVPAREQAQEYDSVTLCFNKGLGCPVGGALAGDRAFITQARVYMYRLGGVMRKAGIIAAACLYALDHNIERLVEDHENAKLLARGLAEIPGIAIDVDHVETNIVFFDVSGIGLTAEEAVERLQARGVRMKAGYFRHRVRAVTHLSVTRADIERAVEIAQDVLGKARVGIAAR